MSKPSGLAEPSLVMTAPRIRKAACCRYLSVETRNIAEDDFGKAYTVPWVQTMTEELS